MNHIIAIGNPFDGLVLVGPFESGEAANDYGDDCCQKEEWHAVEVEQPYQQAPITFDAHTVDWELLRQQKSYLIDTIQNEDRIDGFHPLDGVVSLLDDLQDRAAALLGETAVFGKRDE